MEEILQAVEIGKITGKELVSFSLIDSEHTATLLSGAIGLLVKVEDEGVLLARPEDMQSGRGKTMKKVRLLKQKLKSKGKPSIEAPEELLSLTPNTYMTQRDATDTRALWNEAVLDVSKTSVIGILIKVPMVMPLLYECALGCKRENLEVFFEKLFAIDSSIPVVVLETSEYEIKGDEILPDMPRNVHEAQEMIFSIRKKIFRASLGARRASEAKTSL